MKWNLIIAMIIGLGLARAVYSIPRKKHRRLLTILLELVSELAIIFGD